MNRPRLLSASTSLLLFGCFWIVGVDTVTVNDPGYVLHVTKSTADWVKDLLAIYKQLSNSLEEVLVKLENRSIIAQTHRDQLVDDALNLYQSVSGLLSDFELAQFLAGTAEGTTETNVRRVPTNADLKGASSTLFRIQDILQVKSSELEAEMAKYTKITHRPLTVQDFFDIGRIALEDNDYYHALDWLLTVRDRLQSETSTPTTVEDTTLLCHLYMPLLHQGNKAQAKSVLREWRRLTNLAADSSMDSFDKCLNLANLPNEHLSTFCQEASAFDPIAVTGLDWNVMETIVNKLEDWQKIPGQDRYNDLCKAALDGKTTTPTNETTKEELYCFYRRNSPFLFLAPAKVEMLQLKPEIFLFHDIVSDAEIAVLKNLTEEKLIPSVVVEGPQNIVSKVRTSSTAWLFDDTHAVVAQVRKRVGTFTGLSIATAEGLQITRYGVGGNYLPHLDFARDDEIAKHGYHGFYQKQTGNRVATALFYLEPPRVGGSTAFIYANKVVQPLKNTAVFWFNLKTDGRGEQLTYHAGCPTLSGVKWVANLWLHERGQEFRRPCNLKPDDW